MKTRSIILALVVANIASAQTFVCPDGTPADCPFPQSKEFGAAEFAGRHAEYTKADTWYPSWGADGRMYSPFTDGRTMWLCYSANWTDVGRLRAGKPAALGSNPPGSGYALCLQEIRLLSPRTQE